MQKDDLILFEKSQTIYSEFCNDIIEEEEKNKQQDQHDKGRLYVCEWDELRVKGYKRARLCGRERH